MVVSQRADFAKGFPIASDQQSTPNVIPFVAKSTHNVRSSANLRAKFHLNVEQHAKPIKTEVRLLGG
jgi:hypothetical protein